MLRAVAKRKKEKKRNRRRAQAPGAAQRARKLQGLKRQGFIVSCLGAGARRWFPLRPGENLPRPGSSGPGPWAGPTLLFPRLPSACPPSSYGTPVLDWACATQYILVLATHFCGDPTSNKGLFWVWVDMNLGRRHSTRAQP